MDCREFEGNVSSYLDGELKDIDKIEFELHLLNCKECRQKYEDMVNIVKLAKDNREIELPKGYHNILMEKVDKIKKQKKKFYNNWKSISSIAAALILIISSVFVLNISDDDNMSLIGQSSTELESAKSTEMEFDSIINDISVDKKDENITEDESEDIEIRGTYGLVPEGNIEVNLDDTRTVSMATRSMKYGRKLVKTENIEISIFPYEDTVDKITEYIEELGGYVEEFSIDYTKDKESGEEDKMVFLKRGMIKIRVSQDKFEDAVQFIKNISNVEKYQHIENDITQTYSEKEKTLSKLKNEQDKIKKLIEQIDNAEKIIELEKNLEQIRIDIESNTKELRNLDCIINMPEINLKLREMSQEEDT